MNELTTIISTVGFPIVACMGASYFIYQTQKEERKENQEREERLYSQIEKFSEIMTNFNKTLSTVNERLTIIEEKLGGNKNE